MIYQNSEVESAVDTLLKENLNEDDLYTILGYQRKVIEQKPSQSNQFVTLVQLDTLETSQKDRWIQIGKEYFERVSKQIYQLLCDKKYSESEERQTIEKEFNKVTNAVITALAGMIMTHLSIAAAIATTLAAIVVKVVFKATHQLTCDMWAAKLD